jgi:ribonuclease HI
MDFGRNRTELVQVQCRREIPLGGQKTSAGWFIRDYRGQFVLAGSSCINGRWFINEGEAIAILEAMKELHQRGYTNVIFETNSQNVADTIHHMHSGVLEFSSIVCKIICMLSNHYDFEVKSIKRQTYMVTYTLAKAAISWPSR